MKFTQLYVERWLGQKASASANAELLHRLREQRVREVFWTGHATRRAQEMVDAGFPFESIRKALTSPSEVYMSPTYKQPCARYLDVSVALMADRLGRAIVVTVLPGDRRAWEKFHAAVGHGDRKQKINPFEYQGTGNDDTDGKCIACRAEITEEVEATARVTKSGLMCGHCYNREHLPGWAKTIHKRGRKGRGY